MSRAMRSRVRLARTSCTTLTTTLTRMMPTETNASLVRPTAMEIGAQGEEHHVDEGEDVLLQDLPVRATALHGDVVAQPGGAAFLSFALGQSALGIGRGEGRARFGKHGSILSAKRENWRI